MTKLKQGLITIGGAVVLSLVFIRPTLLFLTIVFGPIDDSISIGDIGTDIPVWIYPFSFAFPFFLTLLEFFFKKKISERRPYLYIVVFFVFLSLFDEQFLLVTIVMIVISILPGTLYNRIKDKKAHPSR